MTLKNVYDDEYIVTLSTRTTHPISHTRTKPHITPNPASTVPGTVAMYECVLNACGRPIAITITTTGHLSRRENIFLPSRPFAKTYLVPYFMTRPVLNTTWFSSGLVTSTVRLSSRLVAKLKCTVHARLVLL